MDVNGYFLLSTFLFCLFYQIEAIITTCRRQDLKLNDVLTVQFPGDGSPKYTGGANDCLIVKAADSADKETRVKLNVQYFDIEHHYLCEKDYLEIRDGWGPNAKLLGKWCGVKTDESVESTGRFMFLRVVTDDENFARGFKLHVSTVTDSATEGNNGLSSVILVPICIGIVIFIVSIIVICIICVILPRRKKRQRAAERHGHDNQVCRSETVEMVHVGSPVNRQSSQVVGEPVKPPSYPCAVRENTTRPEIPNVSRVVPSAPPPTYTLALRDPPNRPSSIGLYPQLDVNS